MPKVKVFITIDTEHSIGGAFADPVLKPVGNAHRIFGRIGYNRLKFDFLEEIKQQINANNYCVFFLGVARKLIFLLRSRRLCERLV